MIRLLVLVSVKFVTMSDAMKKSSAGQGTASAKNLGFVSASSRWTLRTAGSNKASCAGAVRTVRSPGVLKSSRASPNEKIMPLTRIEQEGVHLPIVGGTTHCNPDCAGEQQPNPHGALASGTGCQLIDLVNDQGFGEPPCDPGCAATQGFQEMMATTEAELPGQEGATASTLSPAGGGVSSCYGQQDDDDDDAYQVILPCPCEDPLSTPQSPTPGTRRTAPTCSLASATASASALWNPRNH